MKRKKGPFPIRSAATQYGFNFGSAEVTRVMSRTDDGYVCIGITTPKGCVTVYASRTGKLRVFRDNKELAPKEPARE